jgi:uncharacterized protein (DUF736 family)
MNIGNFKKLANGTFEGRINTLDLNCKVRLRRFNSNNEAAPAFNIEGSKTGENWSPLGSLWTNTARNSGEVFYRGYINDPSMSKKLWIAVFTISKGEQAGELAIVWDDGNNRAPVVDVAGETEAKNDEGLGESTTQDDYVGF